MVSARLLLALALLSGCGSDEPSYDHWDPLPGLSGPEVFFFEFDSTSRPLVAGSDGLFRYTEADGWVNMGRPAAGPNSNFYRMFPAADGGTFVVNGLHLFHLDLAGDQLVEVHSWAEDATTVEGHEEAQYVAPDGSMFGMIYFDEAMVPRTWPAGGAGWVTTDLVPQLVDRNGDEYFVTASGLSRRAAGTTDPQSLVDCHQKALLQCRNPLHLLRVLENGDLYFWVKDTVSMEVYRVPATGGDIELAAAIRTDPPPHDYVYFKDLSLTDNGTVYLTAARSNDAYSHGSTFRFAPGHPQGTLILASPGDFDLIDFEPQAVDANITVSPDDTMYWYAPVMGGIGRYSR